MKINTFGVSHDSTECVGYVIDFMEQRIVIVTDCGQPNATMEMYMSTANHLIIEANHDEQMLLNGPYPTYLKERILSPKGHQSNVTCGPEPLCLLLLDVYQLALDGVSRTLGVYFVVFA